MIEPQIVTSNDVGVEVGTDVMLRCSGVLQDDSLMIEWSSSRTAELPDPLVTMEMGNLTSTLNLVNIGLEDNGQYTCTATNRLGSINRTLSLFAIS